VIDQPRLRHDRVGVPKRHFVAFIEVARFVSAHLVDGWLIETLLLSDR